MAEEKTLDQWLEAFSPRFAALYAYAKSPLPNDPGERSVDIESAIHHGDEAGRLKADAESYLTQAMAQAVLTCKDLNPGLTANERKLLVKDGVRKIQRLVDGLTVTERSIKDRIYAAFNANKSRML